MRVLTLDRVGYVFLSRLFAQWRFVDGVPPTGEYTVCPGERFLCCCVLPLALCCFTACPALTGFHITNPDNLLPTFLSVPTQSYTLPLCTSGSHGLPHRQPQQFPAHPGEGFLRPFFTATYSFGICLRAPPPPGFHITNPDDFLPILEKALEMEGPVIIGVDVDYSHNK